ncbi:Cyclic pyranopterin monophosphate synthase [Clarias magur]|uniref:Cyclic pyranopterin monophosphate synthase n=1 Tax=Clarias magur TaxID=1594786 RepID=A0A8J4UB96_CLAMG|nr:Cyclic pyranopterin monophosphate synthase [Clarias magur]
MPEKQREQIPACHPEPCDGVRVGSVESRSEEARRRALVVSRWCTGLRVHWRV